MLQYLKQAVTLPPHIVLKKGIALARRKARAIATRQKDQTNTTYYSSNDSLPLNRYFDRTQTLDADLVKNLSAQYLKHNFNLLGSGWVQVKHGMKCHGLEGHVYQSRPEVKTDLEGNWLKERVNTANFNKSQEIWKEVDSDYEPIDWQIDFRSGYRWSESTWFHDIAYGRHLGVDVKVPWELSRMQHLPHLAIAYGLDRSEQYLREFRNQILDFISTNPPRFGVNWKCTMDVGIRIANWLVAYDLFRANGANFDEKFEAIFRNSVWDHAIHIEKNLEWNGAFRSNHYLANVAGLLFAAAYLPRSQRVDCWLGYAVQEMIRETELQFNEDGSNFEASISYHRLSAEMVVYSAALMLNLNAEKLKALEEYDSKLVQFPTSLAPAPMKIVLNFEKIKKMALFTKEVTKPNGRVALIGDNDSGRFLKLEVNQDERDHRYLISLIEKTFGKSESKTILIGNFVSWKKTNDHSSNQKQSLKIPLPSSTDWTNGIRRVAFSDFGLYLFRSDQFFLSIRCGSIGQKDMGGHAHNDQLSIELNVNGKDWIADPGTYVYTSLPVRRNEYRSVRVHYAPQVEGKEPGRMDLGLFSLGNEAKAKCLVFENNTFVGCHEGFGKKIYRTVTLHSDHVEVEDIYEGTERLLPPENLMQNPTWSQSSPGYGYARS